MVSLPPLLALVGPTGVGKTAVAVRLARQLPIEVVSADSRQVYRGMDIGTGKPTAAELAAVPHHLIDVVDPHERYHAARFRSDALAAIAGIRERGRLPVVVGGTGLYVRALLRGLVPAPPADPALRAELERFADAHGAGTLHARLAAVAPETARRLHPNDRIRIVRALEIHAHRAPEAGSPADGDWAAPSRPWRLAMIGLARERTRLHAALADRARSMLDRGMMDEVQRLLQAGYDPERPPLDGIGYRPLARAARGLTTEEEALRLMVRDTTRYARRQMTWFAREPEIRWIDVDEAGGLDGAAEAVLKQLTREGLIE
ncbi:MAG TPA: tRNA (adenosine(37)-N6)-dimethylallyltransferase MiaA [Candidatus Bathyarchaeia archaeon]|nr:tRNA (adenosine(37)-N6)-dimethylallyltransferase MiaA [Candidatus Bathyarchaeia archaeon]